MTTRISRLTAFLLLLSLLGCGGVAGPSSGTNGTTLQYTAMGDSLAFGILDTQGGYVIRYRNDVVSDTGFGISLINLGVNGAHSGDLLKSLTSDPVFRNNVAGAQVVTWDIGGDDLLHAINLFNQGTCGGTDNQDCMRAALSDFLTNWDAIVQQILALRSTNNTIVRTMDIYNPFVVELMVKGEYNTVEPYLDQANAHIAASAAANHIPMAQVHQAFNGVTGTDDPLSKGLLAPDGIHPNDAGHQVIAEALRALQYAPLH